MLLPTAKKLTPEDESSLKLIPTAKKLTPEDESSLKRLSPPIKLPDPHETSQALKDFCKALSGGYVKQYIFKRYFDDIVNNFECVTIIQEAKTTLQKQLYRIIDNKHDRRILRKVIKARRKSVILHYRKHTHARIPFMFNNFTELMDEMTEIANKKQLNFSPNKIKKAALAYCYMESQYYLRGGQKNSKKRKIINVFTKDVCDFFHVTEYVTVVKWLKACEEMGLIEMTLFRVKKGRQRGRSGWSITLFLPNTGVNLYIKQFYSLLDETRGNLEKCLVASYQLYAGFGTKLIHPDDEHLKIHYHIIREVAHKLRMTPQYFYTMLNELTADGFVTKYSFSARKSAYTVPNSTLDMMDAHLIINHDEVEEFKDLKMKYNYKLLLQHRYDGINRAIDKILARESEN